MTYEKAVAQQKFDGCKVVRVIRRKDHYEIHTQSGKVHTTTLDQGARFFPRAIVG